MQKTKIFEMSCAGSFKYQKTLQSIWPPTHASSQSVDLDHLCPLVLPCNPSRLC